MIDISSQQKNKSQMSEHEINQKDCFILGWYMHDNFICDKLIHFHDSKPQKAGIISGKKESNDFLIKKSTDVILNEEPFLSEYCQALQLCCEQYIKKYPLCNHYSSWGMIQHPNIQKYDPGGAFYAWHTERGFKDEPISSRHLVFMTYLNDVNDGGETEFFYQKIKIKPVKGLTLIWGSDWTFTHRGIPSKTETKYIVTGWFNFLESA